MGRKHPLEIYRRTNPAGGDSERNPHGEAPPPATGPGLGPRVWVAVALALVGGLAIVYTSTDSPYYLQDSSTRKSDGGSWFNRSDEQRDEEPTTELSTRYFAVIAASIVLTSESDPTGREIELERFQQQSLRLERELNELGWAEIETQILMQGDSAYLEVGRAATREDPELTRLHQLLTDDQRFRSSYGSAKIQEVQRAPSGQD